MDFGNYFAAIDSTQSQQICSSASLFLQNEGLRLSYLEKIGAKYYYQHYGCQCNWPCDGPEIDSIAYQGQKVESGGGGGQNSKEVVAAGGLHKRAVFDHFGWVDPEEED